jgi:hypothetical protein
MAIATLFIPPSYTCSLPARIVVLRVFLGFSTTLVESEMARGVPCEERRKGEKEQEHSFPHRLVFGNQAGTEG